MNKNLLNKHYRSLAPQERFRLILAAGGRGDEVEASRLLESSHRVAITWYEHAPYSQAFQEVAMLIFLELQDEAARYQEFTLRTEIEEGEPEMLHPISEHSENRPAWQRMLDIALSSGFTLKVKAEGWKLFCANWNLPPHVLWKDLPGYERLMQALKLTEEAAFTAEGLLAWLNRIRPVGEEPMAEVPLTAENIAACTEQLFLERVCWWSG